MLRYSLRDSNWRLTNTKTGEVADVDITIHRGRGKFMKVWQDGTKALLERTPQLRGQSIRILLYLTAIATWNNCVPTPVVIASKLGAKKPNVYRAYAELIKADFVIKRDDAYYLSPLYCWKGNQMQFEEACHKLLCPSTDTIKLLP